MQSDLRPCPVCSHMPMVHDTPTPWRECRNDTCMLFGLQFEPDEWGRRPLLPLGDSPDSGALRVCRLLDGFQKEYEFNTRGNKMPGNDLYSDKLMAIVEEARAAIAGAGSPKGSDGELEAARAACTRYKGYLPTVIKELENDLKILEAGTPVEAPGDSLRESEEPVVYRDALETIVERVRMFKAPGPADARVYVSQVELAQIAANALRAPKASSSTPRSREAAEGSKSPSSPGPVPQAAAPASPPASPAPMMTHVAADRDMGRTASPAPRGEEGDPSPAARDAFYEGFCMATDRHVRGVESRNGWLDAWNISKAKNGSLEEGKGEPLPKTVGGPKTGLRSIEQAAREYVAAHRKAGAVRFGPGNAEDAFDADAAEDAAWTNLCVAVDGWTPDAQGSEARSARESSSGPSPESSPKAAPQGVEARPMKDGEA